MIPASSRLAKNCLKRIVMTNSILYKFHIRFRHFLSQGKRRSLAKQYLKGAGIEIGALHLPLAVSSRARVRYVDRLPVSELRLQYPELREYPLVDVNIIDDGETLEKIESGCLDFVIANHFLEHCENPIGAIKTFLRVLKKGGIIYLAIPDKRFSFDSDRPITKLEHIIKDYTEGTDWSHDEHFHEWHILVDKKFRNDPKRRIETLMDNRYSIHFHVWTYLELFELMLYLKRDLNFGFEVKEFVSSGNENIFILAKTD